jgi:hypothetical protein
MAGGWNLQADLLEKISIGSYLLIWISTDQYITNLKKKLWSLDILVWYFFNNINFSLILMLNLYNISRCLLQKLQCILSFKFATNLKFKTYKLQVHFNFIFHPSSSMMWSTSWHSSSSFLTLLYNSKQNMLYSKIIMQHMQLASLNQCEHVVATCVYLRI